jgi:hypothetical protein
MQKSKYKLIRIQSDLTGKIIVPYLYFPQTSYTITKPTTTIITQFDGMGGNNHLYENVDITINAYSLEYYRLNPIQPCCVDLSELMTDEPLIGLTPSTFYYFLILLNR